MSYANYDFDSFVFNAQQSVNSFFPLWKNNPYAMPLFASFIAVSSAREIYSIVDEYAKFYAAASKKLNQNDDTNSWFSKKNVNNILIPYGNRYVNRFKATVVLGAEIAFTTAAQLDPTLFPVGVALELYRVGNALYSIGSSAYGVIAPRSTNQPKVAAEEQKHDWLISGVGTMLVDNMLHAATFPLCIIGDLYSVKLAVQSWYAEDVATVEVQKQAAPAAENAKAPLLFAEQKNNEPKLVELVAPTVQEANPDANEAAPVKLALAI